jgi:hypothetical protein
MARVISNVDRVALCGNAKLVVANDLGAPCGSALLVDQSEKIFPGTLLVPGHATSKALAAIMTSASVSLRIIHFSLHYCASSLWRGRLLLFDRAGAGY